MVPAGQRVFHHAEACAGRATCAHQVRSTHHANHPPSVVQAALEVAHEAVPEEAPFTA